MYLSKVVLDLRHPSVRQALRDVNDMHRNLMAGFSMNGGKDTPRADMQVLYRVFEQRERVYLLVSSTEKPNAEALAKRGFRTDDTMIRDVSALRGAFMAGRTLRFELLASPCRKVSGDGNSRRFFLTEPEERAAWLQRKGETGGFEVLSVYESSNRIDLLGHRDGADVKNSAVLFSGVLKITDEDAFWMSYTQGIGPGKAYGLGMLNVAND